MYLDASGKYSAFEELMSYYNLNFYAYLILMSIVLVNCIKAIFGYYNIKNGKISKINSSIFDILTSVLSGFGLFMGLYFHGVIADISDKHSALWTDKMLIISIVAFVLFLIQLAIFALGKRISK
ncbi:hypothetical protein [Tissierella sp.]|uniref:hypothetical protein n=1 Tax=Tissierella sp. TaxID=41274 RepID=UPI0028662E9E|nr:hypothetical protein [Tissierella sp.]MDR7857846.1 hypothetical protein [Tissierella sp.]